MLHKTAEDIVDCSMVWDIIMQQHPQDSNKVHELFNKHDLPTPVIVSKKGVDIDIEGKLQNFISQDKAFFFNGFSKPDMQLINQFILDTQKASKFFHIEIQ